MEKDRITEAYYDEMGQELGREARQRIHWICEQAKGEKILDVGCSQGIASILLGREGKHALGMDISPDSIDYANRMLESESINTRQYIEFKTGNFIDYNFEGQVFESIIMGNVIEHITDSERFMEKVMSLLNDDGHLVVTVPFGVNNYADQKKIYYLTDVINLKVNGLVITDFHFMGNWVGVILQKRNDDTDEVILNSQLVGSLEKEFFHLEKKLINEIESRDKMIERYEKEIKEMTKKLEKATDTNHTSQIEISNLNQKHIDLEKYVDELHSQMEVLNDSLSKKDDEMANLRRYWVKARKAKLSVEEYLLNTLIKEEELNRNYRLVFKKYEALSTSKLGKITLKYWNWRRK